MLDTFLYILVNTLVSMLIVSCLLFQLLYFGRAWIRDA
jgi:hypothetical protein